MNFSLLDRILETDNGFLVTILDTRGHSYQKTGARALFAAGDALPVWGNLGSLCVDQTLIEAGTEALRDGKPRRVRIDTTDRNDALLGTGTACGGTMELLIEPVLESHRAVYREVLERLQAGETVHIVHDTSEGAVVLASADGLGDERFFVESIAPPTALYLYGATPLAQHVLRVVADMGFALHVVDWREAVLDTFRGLGRVELHLDDLLFTADSFVVVMSHSFERDVRALEAALESGCPYIGLLSSTSRRDLMYEELERRGVDPDRLADIHSPVGLDIGARSDAEIAVSIAAELVRWHAP